MWGCEDFKEMKNKNVFVTGAGGFIGSHLTERLVKEGANVTALVKYNSMNKWGFIDNFDKKIKEKINVVPGDLRDGDFLRDNMKDVDVVFHLGALIAIPYSYKAPRHNFENNVVGTLNVMEAARKNNVKKVIHTSTSEVYGTPDKIPIKENSELRGQSPYSASKIGADKVAESYFYSFNLPVLILRPFNTYGPRQSARAIIPTIIMQALKNNKIIIGNPKPTRDFNFVYDIVDAYIKAAKTSIVGETINIGTGKEVSISQLAEKIKKVVGKDLDIVHDKKRYRPGKSEVLRLCADNSKAKKLLGWNPKFDLDEGLKITTEWIKNNINFYKTNLYNI